MPIYINQNGQQSGPYEDHIVIDQLRNGTLSPNDLAIRHGDASWSRLSELFPGVSKASASPAAPAAFVESPKPPAPVATPVATPVSTAAQPEPQYRSTGLQKAFFALCFVGVLSMLGACVYYVLTFGSTGDLEADLSRLGYRDLAKYLAIGCFVGAFFTLLALVLSFKRKLIRANGARIALRVFFALIILVGFVNIAAGAVSYLNYSAPTPTKSSQSNELLRALEAGSAATGPYETAMITVPIGAGLFLFGLSGLLMTKRPRS